MQWPPLPFEHTKIEPTQGVVWCGPYGLTQRRVGAAVVVKARQSTPYRWRRGMRRVAQQCTSVVIGGVGRLPARSAMNPAVIRNIGFI